MIKFIAKTLIVAIIFSLSFCVVYQYTCPKYYFKHFRSARQHDYIITCNKVTGEYFVDSIFKIREK